MSLFNFFRKKEIKTREEKKKEFEEQIFPQIITYGIAYKFNVHFLTEGKTKISLYNWTSDIFYDYRQALKSASETIRNIYEDANKDTESPYIYIIDACIPRKSFIKANAFDPTLLTFVNDKLVKASDVAIMDNGNLVIEDEGKKLTGNFKVMVDKTDW
jgi:uncharacterized Rmd1/YagE family protein